uniref:Nucleolin 2-like n=1 Tax=Nicotiana tabacum TaxID=4097 RepID=A0A1S3YYR2_TOBAC|nr:PREDICTED: nucleolin 2-like [Nicotiana tabacum]
MELSKGRWEAWNHGLGKDVVMRPSYGDEEFLPHPPASKQAKEKKRKGSLSSPGSKRKRPARRSSKPMGDTSAISSDSICQLRDESEEEEEDNSKLVAQVRAGVTIQEVLEPASAEVETSRHEEVDERALAEASEPERVEPIQPQARGIEKETRDDGPAEAEEFKKIMDIVASKKETVEAQLESVETQLQAAKEKASENLANELEVARSEVAVANTKADAKVAQFKVDVEAIQAKAKSLVDHPKWQDQREVLEGVHAQGFDIMAEIENTKAEETSARKLAFSEEDSDSLSESEDEENP